MEVDLIAQFLYLFISIYAGWITSDMIIAKSYRSLIVAVSCSLFMACILVFVYTIVGWL